MAKEAPLPRTKSAAYRVLALKYRPQVFDDLIGQDHIKAALTGAIKQNKVAHAFLFAGSRGTGKTTTARILAKALNCLSSDKPTIKPCGTCVVCREIADTHDLDVMEIDGASNNSVEQVRDLLANIENRPARGRYRIVIIDEVHMLSIAAFNALLKTLEEPPAHVKFIFATTDPHKVPETIHSRCQHYDFRRLTSDEITGSLGDICKAEGISAEPGVLTAIAGIAEGGMRDAQSKLDQLIAFRGEKLATRDVEDVFGLVGRGRMIALLGAMRTGATEQAFEALDEVFRQGKDLRAFVVGMLGMLRDALVLANCSAEFRGLDLAKEERERLSAEAKQWKPDALVYAMELLSEAGRRLKGADYPRVVLETTLFKLCRLPDLRPIEDVIAALDILIAKGGSNQTDSQQAGIAHSARTSSSVQPSPNASLSAKTAAVPVRAAKSASKRPEPLARAKALIEEVFDVEEQN